MRHLLSFHLFGIPIRFHWSFALFGLALLVPLFAEVDTRTVVVSGAFILIILVCILLHELGHAKVAGLLRVRTEDIILTPIGGLVRLHSSSIKPGQEVVIALGGPMVNLVVSAFSYGLIKLLSQDLMLRGQLTHLISDQSNLLQFIFWVNILIGSINLIPTLPLDGGRILRAMLRNFLGHHKATIIVIYLGLILSAFLFVLGIISRNAIWSSLALMLSVFSLIEYLLLKRSGRIPENITH